MGENEMPLIRVNYRVTDFLDEFGIGRTKFYALVNAGAIRTVKCGSRTLVPHSAALEFQAKLEAGELATSEAR